MATLEGAVTGSMSEGTGEAQTVKQSKKPKPKCCDPREGNCTRKDWHALLEKGNEDDGES